MAFVLCIGKTCVHMQPQMLVDERSFEERKHKNIGQLVTVQIPRGGYLRILMCEYCEYSCLTHVVTETYHSVSVSGIVLLCCENNEILPLLVVVRYILKHKRSQ